MQTETNDIRQLAARIRNGDSSAIAGFVKQLKPQLACMIRRVMRTGSIDTAVAQRIVAEAGQLSAQGLKDGVLVEEITGRICGAAVAGLRSAHADGRNIFETIVGTRVRAGTTIR